MNVAVQLPAVQYFLDDPDLLLELLVGVVVVGVDDAGRIYQIVFFIQRTEHVQILIMIVGQAAAVFVHGAAQYRVSQRVAAGVDFVASVDKRVGVLRRIDGV